MSEVKTRGNTPTESIDNLKSLLEQYLEELEASESRLHSIIEKNADGILIVDQNGRVCFSNPAAKVLLQRDAKELAAMIFGYPVVAGETTEIDIIRQGHPIATAEMRVVDMVWEKESAYLASLRDITARKQAENQIAFQVQLLNTVEQGVIATDLNGAIIYSNRFAETLYRCPTGAALTCNILDLIPPGTKPQVLEILETIKTGAGWSGEIILRRRDDTTFPAMMTISPVFDSEGLLVGSVGITVDITERKKAEQSLFQRNRELTLLNGASQAFISSLDLDQVLTTVLEAVRYILDVTACSIWLIDPDTGELVCRQATDPHSHLVRHWRLSPGHGVVGQTVRSGRSMLIVDATKDQRHYKGVDQTTGLETRSLLSVPLIFKNTVIGVIQVIDEQAGRFDQTDLNLLESLAAPAAIAIENAQFYSQALQDSETKAILLNEVNHRVKNNLAAIIGLLYAEQRRDKIDTETAYRTTIKNLINRIQGLATVHDMLSAVEWRSLPLDELTNQIVHASLQSLPPDKHISVNIKPDKVEVTPKQANCMALVINELATNTVKYALSEQDKCQINIDIVQSGHQVTFKFKDNGPGYPATVLDLDEKNIGLYLIENVVRNDLQGKLELDNENGAVTKIQFNTLSER